jgi:hypothetical protein
MAEEDDRIGNHLALSVTRCTNQKAHDAPH